MPLPLTATPARLERVVGLRGELPDEVERRGVPAEVELLRRQAQERPGEGPAAARVGEHVDLVDDGDVDWAGEVCHLDGAREVGRAVDGGVLLPWRGREALAPAAELEAAGHAAG